VSELAKTLRLLLSGHGLWRVARKQRDLSSGNGRER
jgi:hypothetical protein